MVVPLNVRLNELEGVAQRELNQPRCAHGGNNFAKRAGILHVRYSRTGKVYMIPNVKEVGSEAQAVALGDSEILDEGEIPVLLPGTAKNVAPEIPEVGGAEVRVVDALRRIQQRSGGKGIQVKVPVDACVDVAAGGRAAESGAGSEAA